MLIKPLRLFFHHREYAASCWRRRVPIWLTEISKAGGYVYDRLGWLILVRAPGIRRRLDLRSFNLEQQCKQESVAVFSLQLNYTFRSVLFAAVGLFAGAVNAVCLGPSTCCSSTSSTSVKSVPIEPIGEGSVNSLLGEISALGEGGTRWPL